MKSKIIKLLFISFSVSISGIANAGLIYVVNLVHDTGSVFGTIETDGSFGELTSANILNIDLSMQSTNIDNNELQLFTSVNTSGSLFTASETELTFDFTGGGNGIYTIFWFIGESSSNVTYWCLNSSGANCDGRASASSLGYKTDSGLDVLTGITTIADISVTDASEPPIFTIFAIFLMVYIRRILKR